MIGILYHEDNTERIRSAIKHDRIAEDNLPNDNLCKIWKIFEVWC